MSRSKQLSRITIDIPEKDHKQFKALAAFLGKSMRELVIESIQDHLKRNKLLAPDNQLRK